LISWAVTPTPGVGEDRLDGTIGLIQFTLERWGLSSGEKQIKFSGKLYNKLY